MERAGDIGILFVDDESSTLKYFEKNFRKIAPVYTAANGEEGLKKFIDHRDEIGVVLSDKNMPGMTGLEMLERVRRIDDRPMRMLLTAYSDLPLAVEALNEGLLYSYLAKPMNVEDLRRRLLRAVDRFWINRERHRLLKDRTAVIRDILISERIQNIETISTGLNHHLRNAFNSVHAFLDMLPIQLDKELSGPPKDRFFWEDYYTKVEEQISAVVSMLSNLADGTAEISANSGSVVQSDIAINKLVNDIFSAKNSEGIDLVLTSGDEVNISSDPARFGKMMECIIDEAISNIGVDIGKVEVIVDNTGDWNEVKISVLDSGDLIPEEERERIFDPFYIKTSSPSDFGTNLVISYFIVHQLGGQISGLKSSDGRNQIEVSMPKNPGGSAPINKLIQNF